MQQIKQWVFTHNDRFFVARVYRDEDMGPPWKEEDGHGPVYEHRGEPVPGKRLYGRWYYDWDEAIKIAERDGWNAEPYDAPNRAERAVKADFERLRGWLRDDWFWVGVSVTPCDEDGEFGDETYTHALWGIESDSPEYHRTVAIELAQQA